MVDLPSRQAVMHCFDVLGQLLGRRVEVHFFEGGYSYHVVPEPGGESAGIARVDVVGDPSHGAAAHQHANHCGLFRLEDVECGICLYGKGHKGFFRRERGAQWDRWLHG